MKKILATILALAMVMSLGVSAFAADTNIESTDPGSNSATGDVYVVSNAETGGDIVYYVTVSIPEMSFTYNGANKGTWNPQSLTYDSAEAAGWEGDTTATIGVTNKSNAAVVASVAYAPEAGYDAITGTFDQESDNLDSADNGEGDAGAGLAEKTEFVLTIGGTPASSFASTKVGTVTVTITAA